MSLNVRHFQLGDHVAIAETFTRAVHESTVADYTQAQRDVWAPRRPNLDRWRARCEFKRPWVCVNKEDVLVAFLELDHDGHIDCAYTHPDFAGQGAMTLLYLHVEDVCRTAGICRLWAEVSLTAQPFFAARGWSFVRDDAVVRDGVELPRAVMEKMLTAL